MGTNQIVAELEKEIARLQQARALLLGSTNGVRSATLKRRTLSPEAREKIAEAQKRRWAKAKKTAK